MTIWVLTKEVNDYNQHGEYFIAAWGYKPSSLDLSYVLGYYTDSPVIQHLIHGGGGRQGVEDVWYYLYEYEN